MKAHIHKELAARYGTPLYVYDLGQVEQRYRELTGALPEGATVFFSVKANPLPPISKVLCELGASIEVCSEGELAVAEVAGFPPDRILFGGPGKTDAEIIAALEQGVRFFSIESLHEIARLETLARAYDTDLKAILRVNPSSGASSKLKMTGTSSQFGIDEEQLLTDFVPQAPGSRLRIVGLHIYYGTQFSDPDVLQKSFVSVIDTARRITEALSIRLDTLNLGGGFAWPFANLKTASLLPALADTIMTSLANAGLNPQLYFESGRYLTASSGALVTRIIDVKKSRGAQYVITDAGINHFGGMAGTGRVLPPEVSAINISKPDSTGVQTVNVVGPLCTPLDYLARQAKVAAPAIGDLLMVPNVGAYGATASLTNFLSKSSALEISHRDGNVQSVYRLRTLHTHVPFPSEILAEKAP
jgi:diaminopimelate decarboxylase